ncbi:MAG: arsenosugar biosynthesis radical SAM protein ArsS [Flavobacteriaceae bacterium]|nr:arsenosugar biosynthesis radical SAM protein ArsS [Flavobacteriaceae bacterium]
MSTKKSLKAQNNVLSDAKKQLQLLSNSIFLSGQLPTFSQKLQSHKLPSIKPKQLEILQLNIGYMCNQVCAHCHVDAGPDRKEKMSKPTMSQCLQVAHKHKIKTLDITGGAPEMHPDFRWFIKEAKAAEIPEIIIRSNLTILRANKKYYDLPDFFKEHQLHIISSLPFYRRGKTDRQRGDGVFNKSIEALQKLNEVGYGLQGTGLEIDLVYNPLGAYLPRGQEELEEEYKHALREDFGIEFNNLYCITNLPISRFLDFLVASGNFEGYMTKLVNAFNPSTVGNLMCTNTISVSYDGYLYDCDFNQMLELNVSSKSNHISNFEMDALQNRNVCISQHCYGCTAGAGSSCQGTVV